MKKRILMGVLAAVMSVSLCGCANLVNKVAEGAKDKLTETLEDVAEGAQEAIDKVEDGLDELKDELKDDDTGLLHPQNFDEYTAYQDGDNGAYYTVDFSTFEFDVTDSEKYSTLVVSVMNQQEELKNSVYNGVNEMLSEAKSFADANLSDWGYYNAHYSDEYSNTLERSDSTVFSYITMGSGYYGGAHGSTNYWGHNFDSKTGKEIPASEFFKDADGVAGLIYDQLMESSEKDEFYDASTLKDDIAEKIKNDKLTYVITYNGIEVIFDAYEIAPYAAGAFVVWLYPEENSGFYEEKYLETPDNYVSNIGMRKTRVDLNGDGIREDVTLAYDFNPDYSEYNNVGVAVDTNIVKTGDYAYGIDAYLVKNNDKYYIYEELHVENDYTHVIVFDISSGNPVRVNNDDYGLNLTPAILSANYGDWNADVYKNTTTAACITDPAHMQLASNTDYLSTVSGFKEYYCDDKGLPVAYDNYDAYLIATDHIFTVLKKFNAVEVDRDGKVLGPIEVPKGEKLTYYRTDNQTYGDVTTSDGKIVRIVKEESENFWFCIDGMDGNDVLDGVIFAG